MIAHFRKPSYTTCNNPIPGSGELPRIENFYIVTEGFLEILSSIPSLNPFQAGVS